MIVRSRSGLLRGGWVKSSVGDEEEIKALAERVLHELSVWTLKSPREVRERRAEEGREPDTRLTYNEGQDQVVNIADNNIEDCFAFSTCGSIFTYVHSVQQALINILKIWHECICLMVCTYT